MTAVIAPPDEDEPDTDDEPRYYARRGKVVGEEDKLGFYFDDEHYVLIRPKLHVAVQMMSLAEPVAGQSTTLTVGRNLTQLMLQLLNFIEEEPATVEGPKGEEVVVLHGRARLLQRLETPADGFDLDDLEPVFRQLTERVFGPRPTSASPESITERRGSASNGSAGSSPSTPAKTSGTSRATSGSRSVRNGRSKASTG